ncbi:MAG: hypothetical protein BV459_07995 [Thermoplasmata archaeon M11B2D]|nr:MAG: hypothetical protein BV459_07995 [Thermoplasmata archaeon M11B2D]
MTYEKLIKGINILRTAHSVDEYAKAAELLKNDNLDLIIPFEYRDDTITIDLNRDEESLCIDFIRLDILSDVDGFPAVKWDELDLDNHGKGSFDIEDAIRDELRDISPPDMDSEIANHLSFPHPFDKLSIHEWCDDKIKIHQLELDGCVEVYLTSCWDTIKIAVLSEGAFVLPLTKNNRTGANNDEMELLAIWASSNYCEMKKRIACIKKEAKDKSE